ncbi:S1-like domain-containing RNA-binding protein [Pontibacter sp. G13]|uniref:CvfB family protein n=1 Tax=Pontibacter sp. G13 TaxID=3074898 RepID=UPI00288A2B67|nr:S1-like domain-containing RNA-binding protein [Pontibacter sp. G13]WNJ17667.1 S1-like domain-containing RNA-binding protein [Pontibacter sp. G13]
MIRLGHLNELTYLRRSPHGIYLVDEEETEVLLPNKYVPEDLEPGEALEVFVYRDHEERPVATTLTPYLIRGGFAHLQVKQTTDFGAFLDWGIEKDLLVPLSEQQERMQAGTWHVVHLYLDSVTQRLVGSSKIHKFLQKEPITVEAGQEVDLLIWKETELGFHAIVNQLHRGHLFSNEIFQPVRVGDQLKGYVKQVREDLKIDLSLQQTGYEATLEPNSEKLLFALRANNGMLMLTDKSSPESIKKELGMSKKAFKKAVGYLYKLRRITIEEAGIFLVQSSKG